jgi:hypothetical protein
MTKIFAALAALPLLGLAACGSSPTVSNNAGLSPATAARASDSAMAFTSHRSPSSITSCLSSRMRGVHRASSGTATELVIGNGARANAWRITLAPAGAGSAVNVHKPSSDDGSVSEPELRYHIARCVV